MTLASQMTRNGSGMRVSTNKRGGGGLSRGARRRLRTAGVLLGLLVAAGGIAYWQLNKGEAGTDPESSRSEPRRAGESSGTRLAADPLGHFARGSVHSRGAITPGPVPAASESPSTPPPPPVVLSMGSPGGQPAAEPADAPKTPDPAPSAPPAPTTQTPNPTAPTSSPIPTTTTPPSASPAVTSALLAQAAAAEKSGNLLEARTRLSRALTDESTPERDRAALREQITRLNDSLVFSPTIADGDPLSEVYAVQSGDSLVKISRKLSLAAEPALIARVNRMSNPNRLTIGQKLKVLRGPFQAVVDKSDFRMDVYAGSPASPGGPAVASDWVYIRSFRVGLGEKGGTPLGLFAVRDNSKLVNPHWVNPRTGEKFKADDPKNPIGERWIGLDGIEEATKTAAGYGVHGTIDPDSVGKEMSMGCVRLLGEDVELVYELLMPRVSTVRIVP